MTSTLLELPERRTERRLQALVVDDDAEARAIIEARLVGLEDAFEIRHAPGGRTALVSMRRTATRSAYAGPSDAGDRRVRSFEAASGLAGASEAPSYCGGLCCREDAGPAEIALHIQRRCHHQEAVRGGGSRAAPRFARRRTAIDLTTVRAGRSSRADGWNGPTRYFPAPTRVSGTRSRVPSARPRVHSGRSHGRFPTGRCLLPA